MIRKITAFGLLVTLAACGDGQPLFDEVVGDVDDVEVFAELPPGTEDADLDESVVRFEARNEIGGGYTLDPEYDAATDTFTVDNLAFDGFNTYVRDTTIPTLGTYGLYAASEQVADSLTGAPVGQIIPYLSIVAISPNTVDVTDEDGNISTLPRSEVIVVRSGGFFDYGFGGYNYQRREGTQIPETGQAGFSGGYAGFRIYDKQAVIDLVEGDVTIRLDFDDFNSNIGVAGEITNRVITDVDGNVITSLPTPDVPFVVVEGANALNADGELAGEVRNAVAGRLYEEGFYFAVAAGDLTTLDDNGGEIAGVAIFESDDPRFDDMRVQETGAFVVTRNQ